MKNKLKIASTLLGIALGLAQLPALAQRPYNGGPLSAEQRGFQNGYRDGYEFGRNTQVSNREQDIVNQKLRAADQDYVPAFGPKEEYRQGYVDGFRSGLDDSRNRKPSRLDELFLDPNRNRNRDDRVTPIYPQSQLPLVRPPAIVVQPPYYGAPLKTREHGYEHGFRDGYEFGSATQPSFRDRDIVNQKLRIVDRDYLPAFGPREEFRQAYVDGFRNGFDDGRSNARARLERLFAHPDLDFDADQNPDDRSGAFYFRNGWSRDHIASDIGYRDGFNAALWDNLDGLRFQPRQHAAWTNALRGYVPSMGSPLFYKRFYRSAYEAGYRIGFGEQ